MTEQRYKTALERILRETSSEKGFVSRRINAIAHEALHEKTERHFSNA